jgi:predicted glycosyltransferase
VWVPDYAERVHSLAGELSHTDNNATTPTIEFIGPLSRFSSNYIQKHSQALQPDNTYTIVAVLSGLEPQRTLLERELMSRYQGTKERVLIVQGLVNRPNTRIKHANITTVPHMSDRDLASALRGAKHIIARSGYSTIMDLHALGLLKTKGQPIKTCIELIPTPGQPEQEYLAQLHSFSHKITLKS